MAYQRYSLAEDDDGLSWTIVDIFTGTSACVFDFAMIGLELEEAAKFTDLLNDYDMQKRVLYAVRPRADHQSLESFMRISIDRFTSKPPRPERRGL